MLNCFVIPISPLKGVPLDRLNGAVDWLKLFCEGQAFIEKVELEDGSWVIILSPERIDDAEVIYDNYSTAQGL